MVSVEARPSLTGIEVTCPSGFRTRSDIDPDGSALIGDVPAEPCVLRFLGETSARFSPVSAGQAVSCTVEGATATCEVVQEPEPEPEPDPSPEPS